MKKVIFMMTALISAIFGTSAIAQTTVEGSKFLDNWSVGIKGGVVTPMHNAPFWGDMRGVIGVELQKDITPVFGLGVEGQWSVNTSSWERFPHSTTAFDHQLIGVYGTLNLMNLFGGYNGTPRVFEINVVAGTGWLHSYMNNHKELYDVYGASTFNSWYTKFGPDFNFNLGKTCAWTLSLKPSFVYNMGFNGSTGYDIRHGYFEVLAGVTYHFKNSNGTHSFKVVDDSNLLYEIACLQEEVKQLQSREPEIRVIEKIVEVNNDVTVTEAPKPLTNVGNAIGFKINSSEILPTSYASLQNIANIMKEYPDMKLNLIGYSSAAEGSPSYNEILSQHRAESVKNVLVNTFGVEPDRLNIVAKGSSTQPYQENSWNRTVIFQVAD